MEAYIYMIMHLAMAIASYLFGSAEINIGKLHDVVEALLDGVSVGSGLSSIGLSRRRGRSVATLSHFFILLSFLLHTDTQTLICTIL